MITEQLDDITECLSDINDSLDSIASSLRWLCLFFWLPVISGFIGVGLLVLLLLSKGFVI